MLPIQVTINLNGDQRGDGSVNFDSPQLRVRIPIIKSFSLHFKLHNTINAFNTISFIVTISIIIFSIIISKNFVVCLLPKEQRLGQS